MKFSGYTVCVSHTFPYFRDVALSTVKTGMSGKAGNKGAVGVRMIVRSSPICFVCAHMTAHQSHVNERNSDFTDIWKKMTFPNVSVKPDVNFCLLPMVSLVCACVPESCSY